MREAIGQILPLAAAVAISPVPIIAVVLLLATPRGRVNGPVFLAASLIGLGAIGAIVLILAGGLDADSADSTSSVSTVKLVLGLALVVIAIRQWRRRPHTGDVATMPRWMDAIDSFSPTKSAGAGVVLQVLNPKNLVLAIGAATAISQTGVCGRDQAIAYAVFTLIGVVGIAVPVVVFFTMGDRAGPVLASLRTWMSLHNHAIMAVLCLVIGVKLVGDALPGF